MKLALFADGEVGKAIYEWLAEHWPDDLAIVVTTASNEINQSAAAKGLATHIFTSTESLIQALSSEDLDLGFLAWWPKIVAPDVLSLARHGFINTHPSLLPYNRGKHYNFWAIVEQAPFGVTLHKVDAGIDTGDIVAQQGIAYNWLDNGETLYQKATSAMLDLVKKTYQRLRSLNFEEHPQPIGTGSFHLAKELDAASEIHLDQNYSGRDLINLLRARTFPPHPSCWFRDGDEQFEIRVTIGTKK